MRWCLDRGGEGIVKIGESGGLAEDGFLGLGGGSVSQYPFAYRYLFYRPYPKEEAVSAISLSASLWR